MKKIFIIASALLLSLSFTSCDKGLDNPQKGAIDLEQFYANAGAKEAENLIAATYNHYFDMRDIGTGNFLDIISDDCNQGGGDWSDNANKYRSSQELILTPDDWPFKSGIFATAYKVIYECNLIIEKITSNDAEVARIKAEAEFIRGAAMFELVRWYLNPPLADHIYTSEDMLASNEETKVSIDWILGCLDEAEKGLPALSGKGQQEKIGGRVTKLAAKAMAGKVALFYGTWANDNAYVEKAAGYFKSVIGSGLYDLVPNVKDLFRPAADFSSEYIFERNNAEVVANASAQADNRHTWRSIRLNNLYCPSAIYPYGWGYCLPSPEFVEFDLEHDGLDNPRFQSKIMSYEQLLAMDYDDDNKGIVPGVFYPDCCGYFPVKDVLWKADIYQDTGNSFWSRANVPLIRYADVLLMYAETCVILNKDMADGLAALNKVRVRATLDPLTSMTYQDVKDERRAEMWAEQERFFDLRRWHEDKAKLANSGKVRLEFRGYKAGTTEYDIKEVKGAGNGWDDKYLAFPYTTAQLAANPNLKQNPGW